MAKFTIATCNSIIRPHNWVASRKDNQKSPMSIASIYTTRFCPYCVRAKQLLDSKGIDYLEISVDGDRELRDEMTRKSGRHTVPQIWIGEKHLGGCDDLWAMQRTGELDELLKASGQHI